jgi:4-hydroxybenzoate polyprenyl transferase
MKVNGTHYRSLWWDHDKSVLMIIDQRWLPHDFRIQPVETLEDYATAIVEMRVRGAPLIGATAAYGMALAAQLDPSDRALEAAWQMLNATRPTAINLRWALNRCLAALRPLPAGTISNKQAWVWLAAQCGVSLLVLLCLPPLAQIISLLSIPLVAAYPFMKRITWWPQLWLGLTFNWAVLVAYAAKTGELSGALFILYAGLIFWTVGYDTIYACQDIEDDAMIGVKSTARRFGSRVKLGVGVCYGMCMLLIGAAISLQYLQSLDFAPLSIFQAMIDTVIVLMLFSAQLIWQIIKFNPQSSARSLKLFKSNFWAGLILILWVLPQINSIELIQALTK